MTRLHYLLILFIAMMAADGWTTAQVIRFGGYEMNHWLRTLMAKIGVVPALLVAKIAPIAVVIYAVYLGKMPFQLLLILDIGYAIVVYNNWNALQRQKGN